MKNYILKLKNLITKKLTFLRGTGEFSKSREFLSRLNREATKEKLVMETLSCPYCLSRNFQKRGFRQKKLERVQLYLCNKCNKTFTAQRTKGKHYPLSVMLDAISTYNLGYSLEETCQMINPKFQAPNPKQYQNLNDQN
jgi:transposase-like protein